MKTMEWLLGIGVRLAICFAATILTANSSIAQPAAAANTLEQKIHLAADKSSLDDVLASLTKQTHVNILADGEPLLPSADLKYDGSLHDALDKVADAFDYTWTLSKGGAVLMSKRFKNPDERPQLNLPEMLEMTRNIVRALTLVDYNRDEAQANEAVKHVFQSLTPAQMGALAGGAKLRGTDLAPEQKAAIQQAILTRTFAPPLKLWEDMIPRLVNFKTSKLQARPRTPTPPTPPTHDYFYLYLDADAKLHSFEIQHMMYGENGLEIRTP